MGIHFNGNVTVNGNVEIYENGSMKLTANQLNINISDLQKFIEDNLKYSPQRIEYLEAAEVLQTSNEPSKIKNAIQKLGEMAKDLAKNVMFTGLSQTVIDVLKGLF